jgi:hypothetical protein
VGVNREHAAELVAVAVHQRAPAPGAISMPLVYAVIAELCKHPADCVCGRCTAGRKAKPEQIYRVASAWANEIAATRARARR